MKYTIHGYNQQVAVNYNLNNNDLLIIRWFEDFIDTGSMESKEINNELYYWIRYEYLIEQLPCLMMNKRTLQRVLKNLVDTNIFSFHLIRKGGNYTYYKINDKCLEDLKNYDIGTQKNVDSMQNIVDGTQNIVDGGTQKNVDSTQNIVDGTQNIVDRHTKNCNRGTQKIVIGYTKNCDTNINLSNINQSSINQSNINSEKENICKVGELDNQNIGDIENFVKLSTSNIEVQNYIFNFIDHRKKIKSPMNDNSIKEFVRKVNRIKNDDDKIECISNAIIGDYKTIFPPKENNSKSYQSNKSSNKKISDEKLKALEEEFNY